MSPIIYIEAKCDQCEEEIYSGISDIEFAILRNGHLLCKSCADQKPDQVLKWFSVAKLPDDVLALPEAKGDPTAEEVMKDIESLEETPEEEPES